MGNIRVIARIFNDRDFRTLCPPRTIIADRLAISNFKTDNFTILRQGNLNLRLGRVFSCQNCRAALAAAVAHAPVVKPVRNFCGSVSAIEHFLFGVFYHGFSHGFSRGLYHQLPPLTIMPSIRRLGTLIRCLNSKLSATRKFKNISDKLPASVISCTG